MAVVLEFDELPENAQVMLATQSGGCLIGRAVNAGGGGGGGGFELVTVTDADHVFNGSGAGGAVVLSPMTIVQCRNLETTNRTFKLDRPGVQDGWIVFFNLEGVDPGAVTITNQDDFQLAFVDVSNPTGANVTLPYPAFYFDASAGGAWILLRSVILTPD